jgi:hypothetical protein
MTTQEKLNALKKVIQFAKENGFKEAETLFWDSENPECGAIQLADPMEDASFNTEYAFGIGIDLCAVVKVKKVWPDDDDKDTITVCSDTNIEVEE